MHCDHRKHCGSQRFGLQGKRERKTVNYEGAGGGEMADSDFEVESDVSSEESEEDMEV